MDRKSEVLEIYTRDIPRKEKIHLLEEIILDMSNEEEALDQNMRPEIQNKLSEGLMLAKNLLRQLRSL